jgi:hypothetical protein
MAGLILSDFFYQLCINIFITIKYASNKKLKKKKNDELFILFSLPSFFNKFTCSDYEKIKDS